MGDPNPGGGGRPGVIVFYENLKISVTNGKIRIVGNDETTAEWHVVINQHNGHIES